MSSARHNAINAFVHQQFGLCGTLRLHRQALGGDLLRAPVNVAMAPLFLITRLLALLAALCRLRRLARWLATRKMTLGTAVGHRVATEVTAFLEAQAQRGALTLPPPAQTARAVEDYTGVRNAMAEITTTCIVLICGYLIFSTATPGIISFALPVAEQQAHTRAVEGFWAGQQLGSAYYRVFGPDLPVWRIAATGVMLALLASLVTTFAGIIADPLQVISGSHRRRLARLIKRLEELPDETGRLEKEHVAARSADIVDIALNIWRGLRGG